MCQVCKYIKYQVVFNAKKTFRLSGIQNVSKCYFFISCDTHCGWFWHFLRCCSEFQTLTTPILFVKMSIIQCWNKHTCTFIPALYLLKGGFQVNSNIFANLNTILIFTKKIMIWKATQSLTMKLLQSTIFYQSYQGTMVGMLSSAIISKGANMKKRIGHFIAETSQPVERSVDPLWCMTRLTLEEHY